MVRYLGSAHEEMKKVERIMLDLSFSSSDTCYGQLRKYGPELMERVEHIHSGFNERLREVWDYGLQGIDILILTSTFFGSEYNSIFSKRAEKDNDVKFAVITQLHGRACQISSEIIVLLKNGLPDAAMARWRTLYEVTVCMKFIDMNDPILAKKYLDYSSVITLDKMKEYNELLEENSTDQYPEEILSKQEEKVKRLCETYGPGFKGKIAGWAYKEIEELGCGGRGFGGMEKAVGWGEQHLFYVIASGGVHNGVDGTFQRLCMIKDVRGVVPVGGSNYGLSLPGMLMMRTLIEADKIMFSYYDGSTDEEVNYVQKLENVISALVTIAAETEEGLYNIEEKIKKRDRAIPDTIL